MSGDVPLLEVEDLRIWWDSPDGDHTITTGTDLVVHDGETVGIVGESGSGKTLTARAIVRLLPSGINASGTARFRGRDLIQLPEKDMRKVRGGGISLIFQDPFTMLNPLLRCGDHIAEMATGSNGASDTEVRTDTVRRLHEVGIDDPMVATRYPFQLSGGMRQRVALASALAKDPELLIADEPSTALDVTTQAEILDLLTSVQEHRGMGMILITHDLRVAFDVCDRIYVLYAGSLLEVGHPHQIDREPYHPYTLGLLLSEPSSQRRLGELASIPGRVPAPDEVADQCAFAPRCRWASHSCLEGHPDLVEIDGRMTACIRIEEIRSPMRRLHEHAVAETLAAPASSSGDLAVIENLEKSFAGGRGRAVAALKGVSLTVSPGESVGLVGESGSGKTTLARCLLGLEVPSAGRLEIDGIDVTDFSSLTGAERRNVRQTIQMVFQDPYSTLNPAHTVEHTLAEALRRTTSIGRGEVRSRVEELLDRVGLPAGYATRKPAGLSGGERQRVAIARALAVEPKLLVCDEPVSALDVSVQAQILNLFRRLQNDLHLGYLFITHDLAVVRQVADRVYVLYEGAIVESGSTDAVLSRPTHWYTRRLMASLPGSHPVAKEA